MSVTSFFVPTILFIRFPPIKALRYVPVFDELVTSSVKWMKMLKINYENKNGTPILRKKMKKLKFLSCENLNVNINSISNWSSLAIIRNSCNYYYLLFNSLRSFGNIPFDPKHEPIPEMELDSQLEFHNFFSQFSLAISVRNSTQLFDFLHKIAQHMKHFTYFNISLIQFHFDPCSTLIRALKTFSLLDSYLNGREFHFCHDHLLAKGI